jgi:hypothetical protein
VTCGTLELRPSPNVRAREFEGELVLLDLASGEYFSLNETGLRLWNGIAQGRSADQIAESIAAEYDVTPANALKDVEQVVAELLRRGLVKAEPNT